MDRVGRGSALRQLRQRMKDADALRDSDPRKAVYLALKATRDCLLAQGVHDREIALLWDLLGALYDHSRGKPHPWIDVVKTGGNQTHAADATLQCTAAAAVQLFFLEGGMTQADARREVAAGLNNAGQRVSATEVKTWHHELQNERRPAEWVGLYKTLVAKYQGIPGAGRLMIESIQEIYAP